MALAIWPTARRSIGIVLLAAAAQLAAAATSQAAVTISQKPTQNVTCNAGVCSATSKNAILNVDELAGMLASGDVKVASGSEAQDIELDAALSWASTKYLTLEASDSIAFNKSVLVAGAGGLTITTNPQGDFRFGNTGHVEFSDSHSGLIINGDSYRLMDSIKSFARALRHTDGSGQFFALQKSVHSKKRYSASPIDKQFNGTFEGLGNTITHLAISSNTEDAGLFFSISFGGIVRDLRLVDADISGGGFVGSLAAGNNGIIAHCFSSGRISTTGAGSFVGGLAGGSEGLVSASNSSVTITASGSGSVVGGLLGENVFADIGNGGVVNQSYASGAVTGGANILVGGLTGENIGGIISNSYATGSAAGASNSFAGGLVGVNTDSDSSSPIVVSSYSTGTITGGTGATVGGLIGSDVADAQNTNNYWDLDTSGISDPSRGAGNIANDPGITGFTTEQFKSGLPQGFDKKVWKEKPNTNNGYPYLIDNPPPQ